MIVNSKENQFEITIDEFVAYAKFRLDKSQLYIDYVFAPPELRGKGAANKLMQEIVSYAKENSLEIVPICGYAIKWLSRKNK